MLEFLKRHFIPNVGNDHQPHFLRREKMAVVLLLLIVGELVFLGSIFFVFKSSDFIATVLPKVLIAVTNEERLKNAARTLSQSHLLVKAAKLKADDMARRGYFSHQTPEGNPPWVFLDRAGYAYSFAGENLAVNFLDSKDVVDAWLASDSHRANLLSGNYTEIGIATSEGVYQGKKTTFVVEFFAAPAAISPATAGEIAASKSTFIPQTPTVAGAATPAPSNESNEIAAKIPVRLSAPRHVMNYLLWFTASFVALALLMAIFIKIRVQYGDIIMNGVAVIFFALALLALNYYFFASAGSIPAEASGASIIRAF